MESEDCSALYFWLTKFSHDFTSFFCWEHRMWWGFNLEEERKGRELEHIHSDLVSTAVCFEYDIPIFKLILSDVTATNFDIL